MAKHHGRLELTWTDKDKALLSTADGKYDYEFVERSDWRVSEVRLLEYCESYSATVPEALPENLPQPTEGNLLITGDAMHVLDALRVIPEYADKYLGMVKLCYIDPPFNTGQIFDHYEDNIEHSIWLTMLRDRLAQIKPLLSDDGSVWVHLDDVEVHRCRVVMDEVMGSENFVAEIVWQKVYKLESRTNISIDTDTILVYRASRKWKANTMDRIADPRYGRPDGDERLWRSANLPAPGASTHQGQVYAIQHPFSGELLYPPIGSCWRWGAEKVMQVMSEWGEYRWQDLADEDRRAQICGVAAAKVRPGVAGLVLVRPVDESASFAEERFNQGNWPELFFGRKAAGGIQRKQYLPDKGRPPQNLWLHNEVGHNTESNAELKALFPGVAPFSTPKPERLLQRIITIATDPGDIVLDCFAGSGTTAAVAHKMGRRWVTSELLPETVEVYTLPRLLKVVSGEDGGGITTSTKRVAAEDTALPDGMTPEEAQDFNRLLNKVKKNNAALDSETLKALATATKTRKETIVNWFGGGGFTHLKVGPSMFEEVHGRVLLADWVTNGELTKAMCAQLGVRHQQDGIFAGKKGRVRYVVLDGMVTASTIGLILDQLTDGEIVEVWATQIDPDSAQHLSAMRPGSRLRSVPESVLDGYRRRAATRSPFKASPVADKSAGAQGAPKNGSK